LIGRARGKIRYVKKKVLLKVERLFCVINCRFGCAKEQLRVLAKNFAWSMKLFAQWGLWMMRKIVDGNGGDAIVIQANRNGAIKVSIREFRIGKVCC
jgi:hypothetical protein